MNRMFADKELLSECKAEAGDSKLEDYRFSRLCKALTACSERSDLKAHQRFDVLVPKHIAFLWFTGQSLFPLVRLILPLQVSRALAWRRCTSQPGPPTAARRWHAPRRMSTAAHTT